MFGCQAGGRAFISFLEFNIIYRYWRVYIFILVGSLWYVAFTFKSITSRNAETRPRTDIELNPTKPKMNPKKLDQFRLTMARVGNEPDYTTSHKRCYESHPIIRHFKNREGYWVFCGKLRTYSQHHDIVATPFQKAVATKTDPCVISQSYSRI